MRGNRLSELQRRVLAALSGTKPEWTLTGGAALVGFHSGHRTTRDLDLVWHGRADLGRIPQDVETRLGNLGCDVQRVRTAPSFVRLRVEGDGEVPIVDLVAEPVPNLMPPETATVAGRPIRIDTLPEILTNELCALLQRTELRDLIDLRQMVLQGADLDAGLRAAPSKNGGFSPLILSFLLAEFPIRGMAAGLSEGDVTALEGFRDDLVAKLSGDAGPGPEG